MDTGVSIPEVPTTDSSIVDNVGSALALEEYVTGRETTTDVRLPDPLAEHLDRARQIL